MVTGPRRDKDIGFTADLRRREGGVSDNGSSAPGTECLTWR